MKTKCLIIDDEPIARKIIRNHLINFEDVEIIAECSNAVEAGSLLRKHKIDLIFLDIQMPKVTGFEFLESLENKPKVVIITAHRNYALKSYDFNVLDYLLKPVSFERFMKTMNKFYESEQIQEIEIHRDTDMDKGQRFIYVNEDKTIHKIFLQDIVYVESFREYITIHLRDKAVTTKYQISKFEEKLKDEPFVRIHKSYIIALNKIDSFNAIAITVGGKELPIGRTYKEKVLKTLKYDADLL